MQKSLPLFPNNYMLDFHLNSLTFNDFPQYQPPLSARGQLSVPNFEKGGIKKMSVWEDLRVPAMIICLGEAMFFGFASSISNVDLGLF